MTRGVFRMAGLNRRDLRWVIAILGVALVARVVVIVATPNYVPAYDSGDYQRHAVSIAAGNGYPDTIFAHSGGPTAFRPPAYPYLLGAVYRVSGDSVDAGRLILGAGFGVVAVLLTLLIAGMLWGRLPALIAGGLAAVTPGLFLMNAAIGTEPLFVAFTLAGVLAVLAYRKLDRPDWRLAALAGVMCGLAALTRSNGVLLILALALGLATAHTGGRRIGWTSPAIALVATVLTILPWTIRNTIVMDKLVPINSQSGFGLAGEYNDLSRGYPGYPATWVLPTVVPRYEPLYAKPKINEAELDSELRDSAIKYLKAHPAYVLKASAYNAARALELASSAPEVRDADLLQRGLSDTTGKLARWSFWLLGALALCGVVVLVRLGPRRGPVFVWLVPVLLLGAAVPILGLPRYRGPIEPFVVLLAALAIAELTRRRTPAPA